MLTFVLGTNGSGKSLYGVYQLLHELRRGKRPIVTTLPIDIPALNDYCQRTWPKETIDVTRRVVVINKAQLQHFWRFRGFSPADEYGCALLERGPYGDDTWLSPDDGVLYILDEVQVGFNAREWQKAGPEFCAYQSQHRHFGDDVIAISPASALVDKQFRVLAGECVVLANLYKMRVGIWKAPRKIVYKVFQNAPPMPGEEHIHKGDIHIDAAGLAACYKTQEGLGIAGKQADKGQESRGIPWYFGLAGAGAAGVFAWVVLHFALTRGTAAAMGLVRVSRPAPAMTNLIHHVPGADAVKVGISVPPFPTVAPTPRPLPPPSNPPPSDFPLYWGYARSGTNVFLDTPDGLIQGSSLRLSNNFAYLDTSCYRKVKRPEPAASSSRR